MNKLIRTEKLFGGNKVLVGTPSADLILQSLGKVYIQSGKSIKLLSDIIEELANTNVSKVIVSDSPDIKYESDGQLVFSSNNQTLYLGVKGQLIPIVEAQGHEGNYVKKTGDTMSGTLYLNSEETPLKINSNELIHNLNSEYLDGHKPEDFIQKNKNETITGNWEYKAPQLFREKIIVDDSIGSPNFQKGFQGFGWQLDSETNTLTIDNLIVRKLLKVFELVVNKISATNGSLWITNSAKIKEVFLLESYVSADKTFSIQNGEYTIDSVSYTGNYLQTKYGKFPLTDKENNKYIIDSLNAIIKECNSDFEVTGHYTNVNIYEEYFKKYQLHPNDNLFVIEVNEPVFTEGDLIICQKKDGIDIINYNLLVLQTLWGTGNGQFCLVQTDNSYITLQPEDELVQYGNISNIHRQGSYYITSSDENSPYSLVISGANKPDYMNPYKTPLFNNDGTVQQKDGKYLYTYVKPVKVRLGKLDGQWDNYYLDESGESKVKGWGLYAQDVFLTGEFHLNNGMSIVDFTKEGILLSFKNAGLEIKELSPGNNGIVLKGDQIQINTTDHQGNTIQTALFKDGYISADFIKAFKLESKEKINGVSAWALNADGSGHLAGNNITWDTEGNMSFTGGTIAGIKINAGYLGIKDKTNTYGSLFLSQNTLMFYKVGIKENIFKFNKPEHISATLLTQGSHEYVAKFDNTIKTALKKTAVIIEASNSTSTNCALDIRGGWVEGFRHSMHSITNNDQVLPSDINYIIFNMDESKTLRMPDVQKSDIGLQYTINNIHESQSLILTTVNSKYTRFKDPYIENNIETEDLKCIFLYMKPPISGHVTTFTYSREMMNTLTIEPGKCVNIILSNQIYTIDNIQHYVWIVNYV